jgi:short-subunit dehydrogenase involved in D-alanine esterification of teichoic acids
MIAVCPMTSVPNYCASKAALHSFCTSLSVQLSGTHVKVMELMPP